MERETGFEPATLTLARLCSTPELFPLADCYFARLIFRFIVRADDDHNIPVTQRGETSVAS